MTRMLSGERVVERIERSGVIAIIRAERPDRLVQVAQALADGGADAIEFTMTIPGALEVLRQAVEVMGDRAVLGAGTVLDEQTARAAILAGARFVVTPTLHPATIRICRRYAVPVVPGAFTPTEILAAWEAGADLVKVFPSSVLGPRYVRDVHGPLPHIPLVPTGGVNLENAGEFIRAGAFAIGVGGELASRRLIEAGDLVALAERARQFTGAVAAARRDGSR